MSPAATAVVHMNNPWPSELGVKANATGGFGAFKACRKLIPLKISWAESKGLARDYPEDEKRKAWNKETSATHKPQTPTIANNLSDTLAFRFHGYSPEWHDLLCPRLGY